MYEQPADAPKRTGMVVGIIAAAVVAFLVIFGLIGVAVYQSMGSGTATVSSSGALDPSTNPEGGELTHLSVGAVEEARSGRGTQPVTLTFRNQSSQPIKVYWLDQNGKRVFYQNLGPGGEYDQQTYASHAWLVTSDDGTALVLAIAGDNSGTVTAS